MWQISYPLRMVRVLVAIFSGLMPNSKNIGDSVHKWLFRGQKQAKWGQSKWLWHPNLQTFFDEVIIFWFVGDEILFWALDFIDFVQDYWSYSLIIIK